MNKQSYHRIVFNLAIGLALLLVPLQNSLAEKATTPRSVLKHGTDGAEIIAEQKTGYPFSRSELSYPPSTSLALSWNTFLGSSGGSGMEQGYGITTDNSGNTYIVGTSGSSFGTPLRAFSGDNDAFVAKLDATGNLVWNTFLGATGGWEGWWGGTYHGGWTCCWAGEDEGNGIAVDDSGNVYVTGSSNGTWGTPLNAYNGYSSDTFVAKLDSTGHLVWNTFAGFTWGSGGNDIVVDRIGNIFITGGRYGGAFATRLDGNGNIVWTSPVGRDESSRGTDITLDSNGYVYVAGIDGSGSGFAFFSKVDSSGNLVWTGYLGGPDGYDYGYGIAVEADGNIYVTGSSSAPWGNPVQGFSGKVDGFVAKLDRGGVLIWNTFLGSVDYNFGTGIVVDAVGNIYVSGLTNSTCYLGYRDGCEGDAFTAKLDANGGLIWNTILGQNGWVGAYGIALEAGGDTYIVGIGSAAWGNPVRPYTSNEDAFTAKLDGNGNVIWNTFLGGEPGIDYGRSINVDGIGNIYVTGQSQASWGSPVRSLSGGTDAFVTRLDSTGSLAWNTFLGGESSDEGLGIAVDAGGNTYVVGTSFASWGSPLRTYTGEADAFVAKLDSGGNLLWNTFLGGIAHDDGRAIALDEAGYIYIAGYSEEGWGSPVLPYTWVDGFAAKLDGNGNLIWNSFLGAEYSNDDANGIAVSANGNISLSGVSSNTWGNPVRPHSIDSSFDAFVAQLDSNGGLIWNTFLGAGLDWGYGLAVDKSANVYVTGMSYSSWGEPVRPHDIGEGADAFAAKLDTTGNLVWNTFLGGSDWDAGHDIAVDASGNAYITGFSLATWGEPLRHYAGGDDAFVAQLDTTTGVINWNTFLGGPGWERAYGIAAVGNGNAVVTGYSTANWGNPIRLHSDAYDAFVASVNGSPPLIYPTFIPTVIHK